MLQLIQSINQPIIDQIFFGQKKKLLKYGGGDQIGFQRNHTIIIVVDGVWNNNYLHEIRIKCKWKWLYIVDLDYNLIIIIIKMYLKKTKNSVNLIWISKNPFFWLFLPNHPPWYHYGCNVYYRNKTTLALYILIFKFFAFPGKNNFRKYPHTHTLIIIRRFE